MEYTRNEDKYCGASDTGLYNVTTKTVFSNEGAEPVSLQEAKDWGKIEQDTDDTIITALIKAARRMCEKYSGIGFITRTIVAQINNANGGFQLPYGPVTGDAVVTDSDSDYNDLRGEMEVTYTAGYGDVGNELPEDLKTAILCQFLFLYENRGESNTTLSPLSKMILEPLRTVV